jgi:hypothetical protein
MENNLEHIINNDLTLKFFIKNPYIDWDNTHQVNLRINAIKIALSIYINNL